ncbi:MAG: hypothetical protein K2Q21_10710 [Chitinophagaceae bacterium]|nr:hypothetical protein [Chitinophagaceae bacterium]
MKHIKIIGLIVLVYCITNACKRTNVLPSDPCKEAASIKAVLQISEIHGDSLVETDSVLINNTVSFKAMGSLQNLTSFEFQVEGMSFTSGKNELRLYFDNNNVSPGDLINVRLIVKGTPNLKCFPNDKSSDTVYKKFRIIHWKNAPIIGKYKGYFGSDISKSDPQIVEVRYNKPDSLYTYGSFELFNIDKGCNTTITNPNLWPDPYDIFFKRTGSRFMVFIGGGDSTGGSFTFVNSCHAPSGIVQLKGRDTLTSTFTYSKSKTAAEVRTQESFIGIRIY